MKVLKKIYMFKKFYHVQCGMGLLRVQISCPCGCVHAAVITNERKFDFWHTDVITYFDHTCEWPFVVLLSKHEML